jgi:hypothetical protein
VIDLFTLFTLRLDAAGIDYMVTGSVASMVYGEPRLTHDVDLVLALPLESVPALVDAFPEDEFYCPPAEVMRVEINRVQRGHFNIIHRDTGFKADVYLVGRDPLHIDAMARRRAVDVGDVTLQVAPPDYVIVRKLQFYREGGSSKHLRDIGGILHHSSDLLDHEDLHARIARLGLDPEWRAVQESIASDR